MQRWLPSMTNILITVSVITPCVRESLLIESATTMSLIFPSFIQIDFIKNVLNKTMLVSYFMWFISLTYALVGFRNWNFHILISESKYCS